MFSFPTFNRAILQHIGAASQAQNLSGVLFHNQHCRALGRQLRDGGEDFAHDQRRQAHRRLVEQQQSWLCPISRMESWGIVSRSSSTTVQITPAGKRLYGWIAGWGRWASYCDQWLNPATLTDQGEQTRLQRPDRRRAQGGGRHADLAARDQILLALIWLRQYPTNQVLGFLFGVSDSTASRVVNRLVPLLCVFQSGVREASDYSGTHDWSDASVSKFESNGSSSSPQSYRPDTSRGGVSESADTESAAVRNDSGVGALHLQPLL
jgi:hypothetical protein